jgi:uncharacterized secreted protein with C-terminal beta-propeller domain
MSVSGSVGELSPGERVYSVRFDGDVGYFVTFRNVDRCSRSIFPTRAIEGHERAQDTGFSQYLHVYGEGLLFGLGYDADEETGRTEGMKMSMFDVSDPFNVTEKIRSSSIWTGPGPV